MSQSAFVKALFLLPAALILVVMGIFGSSWLASNIYSQRLTKVAAVTAALPHYGIAAGSGLDSMSPSQLNAYFDGLHKLGAGWVRFDFDWSTIQPTSPASYDWSAYDRIVATAQAHSIRILGILDFTPKWARAADCSAQKQCPPASDSSYAAFAAAAAHRYAPKGLHYWEIWNEPNTSNFWMPRPNAAAYASLLKAAYRAIHQADPKSIVLSGSLAPAANTASSIAPYTFLLDLYHDGAGRFFDALGDHPYTFPLPPNYPGDQAWSQMSQGPHNLRAIMTRHGDAKKKIWITEYGAPTDGPGPSADVGNLNLSAHPWHVTEALQAYSIEQALALYKTYTWVGPLMLYTYQDAGTSTQTSENFFGLVRADGTVKPAYSVVQNAFAN